MIHISLNRIRMHRVNRSGIMNADRQAIIDTSRKARMLIVEARFRRESRTAVGFEASEGIQRRIANGLAMLARDMEGIASANTVDLISSISARMEIRADQDHRDAILRRMPDGPIGFRDRRRRDDGTPARY